MKIEHIAINTPDAPQMAAWYVEHMGLKIVFKGEDDLNIHFLADDEGETLLEFYNNPAADVLDFPALHPLMLHLAFEVHDIEAERERLLAAGCTPAVDIAANAAGDLLCVVRDPFGVSIQLAKRVKPFV